ncbi:MAG: imidazole glycerol phosphate synthase subunit HisH [Pirellulaceae bacterium]
MMASKARIAIVDYALGNLYSVARACERVDLDVMVTSNASELHAADAVVLPGVGAFGDAMANLRDRDLVSPLREIALSEKPLIGICLGLQLLMTESEEFGCHEGLGIIPGRVVHLDAPQGKRGTLKVPHVGWNRVELPNPSGAGWDESPLKGIAPSTYFYFVHSYCIEPDDRRVVLSETTYGNRRFCSAVQQGNVIAFQYHPERSAADGNKVYKNIAAMIRSQQQQEDGKHVA